MLFVGFLLPVFSDSGGSKTWRFHKIGESHFSHKTNTFSNENVKMVSLFLEINFIPHMRKKCILKMVLYYKAFLLISIYHKKYMIDLRESEFPF